MECPIQPGKSGAFMYYDAPLDKQLPIWFHCSEHFLFDAPALAQVYQLRAPPPPPPAGPAGESEEFPVLGTPFLEDNVDSDNEGGMGREELEDNGASAADMGDGAEAAESIRAYLGDEDDEESDEEEEAENEHLQHLRGLLGDDELAHAVHGQVNSEVLAEAFTVGNEEGEQPAGRPEDRPGEHQGDNAPQPAANAGEQLQTHSHVVFVMHGCLGNVARYLKAWKPIANLCGLLVICPQFAPKEFPEYTTGNMFDRRTGRAIPKDQWLFSAVERIFDALVAMGITRTHYHIYGHSSGAQFIHRMMMFLPEARISVGVSANSGWYTFPSYNVSFPYGLGSTGLSRTTLRRSMSNRLVILLGQEDSKTVHLRRTGRSLAQGVNRFDRGMSYFLQAKREAHNLGVPLQWTLGTVEGVAHQHSVMAIAAMSSFGFTPLPRDKRMAVAA